MLRRMVSRRSFNRGRTSENQQKSPVTLEFLANMAAKESRGGKSNHPLFHRAKDLLYVAIKNMVYKLSLNYAQSCKMDVDDLAQDCMKRIFQRMGDYDSKVGKFTTWSWTVCRSVLNGAYRKVFWWNTHIVDIDMGDLVGDAVPRMGPDESSVLRHEILDTVCELAKMYPRRRRLIMGLFGHPEREGFSMPSKIMVADAAKEVGLNYVTANVFYKRVVQPFFRMRFDKARSGDDVQDGVDASTGGMNVVDAAVNVLRDVGRSMSVREMFGEVVARRLYVSAAEEPYISFCSMLCKAKSRGDKRLVKVSPGIWRAA